VLGGQQFLESVVVATLAQTVTLVNLGIVDSVQNHVHPTDANHRSVVVESDIVMALGHCTTLSAVN